MTIETTYSPLRSVCNGVTTSFPLSWPFADPADIDVQLIVVATGLPLAPPPVLNGGGANDYIVTGTPDPDTGIYPNGSVLFNAAPSAAYIAFRARATGDVQDILLPANGRFPAKAVEGALDIRTLVAQENNEALSRAIVAPLTDGPIDMELPPATERAGKTLGFDAAGLATTIDASSDALIAQQAAATAVAAAAALSSAVTPPFKVVRSAALTNINVASAPSTISGIGMALGDRVLLAGQATGAQNGIYTWGGAGQQMTRSPDAANATQMPQGTTVLVARGALGAYQDQITFTLITDAGFVVGTSTLSFEMVVAPMTKTGGMIIAGTVGTNGIGARTDAGLVLYAPTGHSFHQQLIGDPTEESTRSDFGFDSAVVPVQMHSDFTRFVAGINTAGSWNSVNACHMPNGAGNDIVPRIHWSNGATAFGCSATAAQPWATMPPNTWFHIRSGHDGFLVNSPSVFGNGHTFAVKTGYIAEFFGNLQVGDVDGSGVTDHAIQLGYSAGGSAGFIQAFRNSTAASMPLAISGSSISLLGGQINLDMTHLQNAVNDAAAAGAGVPVGGIYRNASVLMVRVA